MASAVTRQAKRSRHTILGLVAIALWLGACTETQLQAADKTASEPEAPLNHESFSRFGSYLAGKIARNARDTEAAAAFYDVALQSAPDNPGLVQRALYSALAQGQFDRALALAKQRVTQSNGASLARLILAVNSLQKGDTAAAKNHLAAQRKNGVAALLNPILTGWVTHAGGDVDGGIEDLKPLLGQKAYKVFADYHKAMMLDSAGRLDEAETAYEGATSAGGGGSSRIAFAYSSLLSRQGNSDGAKKAIDDYLARFPSNPIARDAADRLNKTGTLPPIAGDAREGAAEALFGVAASLARQRSFDIPRVYVHLALRLRPDLDTALILLGELNDGSQRWQDAIDVYRSVPDNSPFKWESRVRIADNLHRLKKSDEALAVLKAMAAERPNDLEPLITSGDILRSEKRYEESAAIYSQAIARIDQPREQYWALYYSRGIAYERSKQWEKAEPDFLKALELKPEQPLVLNYLGYSWVELRRNLDQARGMIERAVEQRPNDGFIVDSLGWALYRLGDFEGAVKHLQRAVELRPEDPVLNDHLGDAYWRVGRVREARFQWRHALVFKPEEDVARSIEDKLNNGLAPLPKSKTN